MTPTRSPRTSDARRTASCVVDPAVIVDCAAVTDTAPSSAPSSAPSPGASAVAPSVAAAPADGSPVVVRSREELRAATVRLADLDHCLKGGSRLGSELELERALVEITTRG